MHGIENYKILDFLFGPHHGTYVCVLTIFAIHFDLFFILVIIYKYVSRNLHI